MPDVGSKVRPMCKILCAADGVKRQQNSRIKSSDPDLGGRMGGGGQGRGRPGVQLIREVYLQCKEKLIRAICVNFALVEEMPALIAPQCPVCDTSAQI